MILRFSLRAFALFVLSIFFLPVFVSAGETDRAKGWAWSSNIGWVSMNCTNTDFCDTVDYGVTINIDNTSMSGWAWSPNIGWIDFSGATFNPATGQISGIANAVAGDVENDGWNGDIVLSATSPVSYGADVQINNEVEGYAWGDTVVGWLSFNCSNENTCGSVDFKTFMEPFYFDFTANVGLTESNKVPFNGNVTLSWTTSGAVSCSASGATDTNWASPSGKSAGEPSAGSETIPAMTTDQTFILTCQDALGRTIERQLPIFVDPPAPEIIITAADDNIPFNTSTVIEWDALHVASCTRSGTWGTGSAPVGAGQSENSGNLTNLENFFNLTCVSVDTGAYPDPIFAQVLVNVEKLTLEFGLDNENIPFADPTELEWTSTFASSCTALEGSGTSWPQNSAKGSVTDQEYTEIVYQAGTSTEPLVTGNYTFRLTCVGGSGQNITRVAELKVGRNPDFSEEIGNN